MINCLGGHCLWPSFASYDITSFEPVPFSLTPQIFLHAFMSRYIKVEQDITSAFKELKVKQILAFLSLPHLVKGEFNAHESSLSLT